MLFGEFFVVVFYVVYNRVYFLLIKLVYVNMKKFICIMVN